VVDLVHETIRDMHRRPPAVFLNEIPQGVNVDVGSVLYMTCLRHSNQEQATYFTTKPSKVMNIDDRCVP